MSESNRAEVDAELVESVNRAIERQFRGAAEKQVGGGPRRCVGGRCRTAQGNLGPIYLAGPMRGFPQWDFPAFDKYAEEWRARGWRVISPAEEDRAAGFDEHGDDHQVTQEFIRERYTKDIQIILHEATHVALIPGWENST